VNALIIANTQIRRDACGRYCLNDLHQASGGEKRHQPSDWLRTEQTKELIAELKCGTAPGIPGAVPHSDQPLNEPVIAISGGFGQGTYAVKELVYAYAMWISARFHLEVIRAYDALVTAAVGAAVPVPGYPQVDHRADQLVSAGRIFGAALRTARGMKLHPRKALRAAVNAAKRHTGIDWEDELDAGEALNSAELDAPPPVSPGVDGFLEAWRAEGLGVPYGPALSRELFERYQAWSVECHERPLSIAQFVVQARRAGFALLRKRYLDGRKVVGPAAFLYPPDVMPDERQAEAAWLGQCVERFRKANTEG